MTKAAKLVKSVARSRAVALSMLAGTVLFLGALTWM